MNAHLSEVCIGYVTYYMLVSLLSLLIKHFVGSCVIRIVCCQLRVSFARDLLRAKRSEHLQNQREAFKKIVVKKKVVCVCVCNGWVYVIVPVDSCCVV